MPPENRTGALWFILAIGAIAVALALFMSSAHAACSSVTVGDYTAYNCDGNLTTEQRSGPYTGYSPKFPSSEDRRTYREKRNDSGAGQSRNVSRETNRVKRQPYSWQRHSRQ